MSPVAAPAQKTPAAPHPAAVNATGLAAVLAVACADRGAPRSNNAQADSRDRARRTGRVITRATSGCGPDKPGGIGIARFNTDAGMPATEVKPTPGHEQPVVRDLSARRPPKKGALPAATGEVAAGRAPTTRVRRTANGTLLEMPGIEPGSF